MINAVICQLRSKPARTINLALTAVLTAYLGLSITVPYYSPGLQPGLAALAGALFFALMALTALLVVRVVDEFQRVLVTRALGCAIFLLMAFAAVWGHLEVLTTLRLPHLPVLAWPVALIVLTSTIKVFLFRREAAPITPSPAR